MCVFVSYIFILVDQCQQEKNIGLVHQALNRASRWALKKLTATYVTLHVSDIGKAVKIDSEDEVRALLLSMVRISLSYFPQYI